MAAILNIPFVAPTTSTYDDKYNTLTTYLSNKFYTLFYKQKLDSELGKDTFCYYDEITYITILIDRLILFSIEWEALDIEDRNRARYDELVEKYQLDCIRVAMNCKFKNGNLLDKLLEEINANYTLPEGVGFWQIVNIPGDNDFIVS